LATHSTYKTRVENTLPDEEEEVYGNIKIRGKKVEIRQKFMEGFPPATYEKWTHPTFHYIVKSIGN